MGKSFVKDHVVNIFFELAKKKSVQKITINDIVTECELSKQTFYNYFKDKNDLILYACTLQGRRNLKQALDAGLNYEAAILGYYQNALSLKYFYRYFIHEPEWQLILFNSIAHTSIEYMKNQIIYHYGNSELTPELLLTIKFNAAGNAHLFVDWITNNMNVSQKIMASVNFNCIPEVLKNYFNCEKISSII